MSNTGLVRTQYWNLSGPNPTPRTGLTSRAESRTDIEGYVLPADAARTTALYDWGVAGGLTVTATAGSAGLTVAQGTALDAEGRVIVLGEDGLAITDPQVPPTGVQNIPTVPVGPDGVVLDTVDVDPGRYLLTAGWREVEVADAGLLLLRQAPWLRLIDPGPFADDGTQVVLAVVELNAGGVVETLEPGLRRLARPVAGSLVLSRVDGGQGAGQARSAQLAPRADGGVDLHLLAAAGTTRRALAVTGAADLELDGGLRVARPVALASALSVSGGAEVTGDLSVTGNLTAGGDLAVAGDVTIDDDLVVTGDLRAATTTLAALKVSGSSTLTGDVQAGGNLTVTGAVTAAGTSRLERLAVRGTTTIGAGGDAFLVTRHVVGKQSGADGPDGLWLNWNTGQTVHVGGGSPADLEVSHDVFVGNRLGVRNPSPRFDVDVSGTVCAITFCNPSDLRLKTGVTGLTGVLDRLAEVEAVTFVPVEGEAGTVSGRRAGVVAQQIERSFPELVVPMGDSDLLAVDYAGLAGVLVGAVNELRAAVTALESRIGHDECG
ncbi:tail fiber domain-containing protein [Actinoplanes sp. NPDC051861]|uniref:tail fiber domain-containing protein n=1 Tax=Actinoplanes sp. NPDC051861 TaxID=3155170 RepID=UPI00344452B2